MHKSNDHRSSQSRTAVGIRKLAFLLSIAVLATACRDGTGPTGASLKVCHMEGSTGTITDIFHDAAKIEAFVRAGERETLKLEGRQA